MSFDRREIERVEGKDEHILGLSTPPCSLKRSRDHQFGSLILRLDSRLTLEPKVSQKLGPFPVE